MAYDIWARATSKWRAMLVYVGLNAAMRFVTALIYTQSPSPGIRFFASVASAATGIFCLVQMWRLLTQDQDGDEAWPPIWS